MRQPSHAFAALAATLLLLGGCGGGGGSSKPRHTGAAPHKRATQTAPAIPSAVGARAPGAHRAAAEPVPILMYHVIHAAPSGAPYPELFVGPADFAAQMRALAARGYHGITLQEAFDAWHRGGLLPSRPIVVSFDDGYRGQYTDALPTLRALRWPGVLNLELHNMDDGELQAPEIRAMLAAGWELDSHTITHPDLTTVDAARLRAELVDSRTRLRRQFGVPVNFFCYPAGRYDARVIAAVQAAGYLGATTTDPGLAVPADAYTLKRVRINGSDGVDGVLRKLAAAGSPQ